MDKSKSDYLIAIDPGNINSGYVFMSCTDYNPLQCGKVENWKMEELIQELVSCMAPSRVDVAIEMISSYGMGVGRSVFDTCVWIGRFVRTAEQIGANKITKIYRKDEKINLCHTMKAKDSNIAQALIDRFAPLTPNRGKGTKKNPGWFYGFKADIWQAYAVGVTYLDIENGFYSL